MIYNIFGSGDSTDIDLAIIVDAPLTTQESKVACIEYDKQLVEELGSEKEINSNLICVTDGVVSWCHKGSVDEVNNGIFTTYQYHTQNHPLLITRLAPRNVELKLARSLRTILQMASRSEYRDMVKSALISKDADIQLAAIMSIDYMRDFDLNKNQTNWVEYRKAIAFQVGQVLGLLSGIELYTKAQISDMYNQTIPMLYRHPGNNFEHRLQELIHLFVFTIRESKIDLTLVKE